MDRVNIKQKQMARLEEIRKKKAAEEKAKGTK